MLQSFASSMPTTVPLTKGLPLSAAWERKVCCTSGRFNYQVHEVGKTPAFVAQRLRLTDLVPAAVELLCR